MVVGWRKRCYPIPLRELGVEESANGTEGAARGARKRGGVPSDQLDSAINQVLARAVMSS